MLRLVIFEARRALGAKTCSICFRRRPDHKRKKKKKKRKANRTGQISRLAFDASVWNMEPQTDGGKYRRTGRPEESQAPKQRGERGRKTSQSNNIGHLTGSSLRGILPGCRWSTSSKQKPVFLEEPSGQRNEGRVGTESFYPTTSSWRIAPKKMLKGTWREHEGKDWREKRGQAKRRLQERGVAKERKNNPPPPLSPQTTMDKKNTGNSPLGDTGGENIGSGVEQFGALRG